MSNKINFVSGETYSLSEFLSGNRCIDIPDLQRDYSWGTSVHKLVEKFMDTLLDEFDRNEFRKLRLGLIYGYESPKNHLQLCDGQQRITTLYLLVGMLNRWSGEGRFEEYLVNNGEPYLHYAVRESSLYFLNDLVEHYFIKGLTGIDDAPWFFNDYRHDPSVKAMISAINTIENYQERIIPRLDAFADFVLERLRFIYYDMVTRQQGEETFVVINTTGEPLTAVENLKPLVIHSPLNADYADADQAWEAMETWFWTHRDKAAFDTADPGFNEFLRWTAMLHEDTATGQVTETFASLQKDDCKLRFDHKKIPLTFVVEAFRSFLHVRQLMGLEFGNGHTLKQIRLFSFLPMLAFDMQKHGACTALDLKRIEHFFANVMRIANVNKSVGDIVASAVEVGKTVNDICDVLSSSFSWLSTMILSDEERSKLKIIHNAGSNRCAVEESLWQLEDHTVDSGFSLFKGQIGVVLNWASPGGAFSLALFEHYSQLLCSLLKSGNHTVNDDTRRALLAWGMPGFPTRWRDYLIFGWDSNWDIIINSQPDEFRCFLDDVHLRGLQRIIAAPIPSPWSMFVAHPLLLAYMDTKRIGLWSGSGWHICQKSHAGRIHLADAYIMMNSGHTVSQRNATGRSFATGSDVWLPLQLANRLSALPPYTYYGKKCHNPKSRKKKCKKHFR